MNWVWASIAVLIALVLPKAARLNKFLIVAVVILSPFITVWLAMSVIGWSSFQLAPKGQFLLLFSGVVITLTILLKFAQHIRIIS